MKYVYAEIACITHREHDDFWIELETDFHIWPNDMSSTYKKGSAELLFIWEE